jgi:predicted nucleic acid-binding protein
MAVLVDTNFLVAVLVSNDINHARAMAAIPGLKEEPRIVAAPVLIELFYLVGKYVGYSAAVKALQETRQYYRIEPLSSDDMTAMEAIMTRYASAEFDYTDAALMALAERLKIEHIYTFDRRDFMIFRPRHCSALSLLP